MSTLTRNGYQVRAVSAGAEAVLLASDPGQQIDMLLTDVVMRRALIPAAPRPLYSAAPRVRTERGVDHHRVTLTQAASTKARMAEQPGKPASFGGRPDESTRHAP